LNLGDVFILDNGLYIYVWMPPQSGRLERIKGMNQAQSIRDQERDGRAAICVLDEDWNTNPDFWGLMGGVSKAHKVKSAEAGGSDENFWRTNKQMVALFKVSDESGKMVLTKVAEDGDIKHSMLDKKDAYILDAWNGGIFVWHGKDATPDERKKSMAYAQKYLAQLGRPQWTQVVSVTSELEPSIFIQWFGDWDKEKSKGSVFQPRLFQCSDESGKLVVEEIADFTQEDLDGDDVMILDIGAQIFVWIGASANSEEKKAALERANKYLDTDAIPRKTKPTIYTIHQGSEGPAFKKIFPEWDDTQYKEQKRSVQNIRKVLFG